MDAFVPWAQSGIYKFLLLHSTTSGLDQFLLKFIIKSQNAANSKIYEENTNPI